MVIGKKDVPGRFVAMPSAGIVGIDKNATTKHDRLREIGQAGRRQPVQTTTGLERRKAQAIEDVRVSNPLEQVIGRVVAATSLVHGAGRRGLGQSVMVQRTVGVIENISLSCADMVAIGSSRPDKPLHAIERGIGAKPKQAVVVILEVEIQRHGALAQIGRALCVVGPNFRVAQRWQKKRRQNRDNCDHHQQFNQRESIPAFHTPAWTNR